MSRNNRIYPLDLTSESTTLQKATAENEAENIKIDIVRDIIIEIARNKKELVEVDFSRTAIGLTDMQYLSKALKRNTHLKTLILVDDELGHIDIEILGEGLKINKGLTELDLSSNQLGFTGAALILNILKVNQNLLEVDLDNNALGSREYQVMKELGKALTKNQKLQRNDHESSLSPSFNSRMNFAEPSIQEIENNLRLVNKILNESSSVIAQGTKDLIREVATNSPKLIDLDLSDSKISLPAINALSQALTTNSNLMKLHLRENKIDEKGAAFLANALKNNSTLLVLDLSKNDLGIHGAIAIVQALKINQTLVSLDLVNNHFGESKNHILKDCVVFLKRNWQAQGITPRDFMAASTAELKSLREQVHQNNWQRNKEKLVAPILEEEEKEEKEEETPPSSTVTTASASPVSADGKKRNCIIS